jgi:hypothetical protein
MIDRQEARSDVARIDPAADRSVLYILAISGTNGSSGFGSHKSEQIDKSTGTKQKLVNVITPKPINTSY